MGKRKGKRGRAARNARKGLAGGEPEEVVRAPHSFVIHRGRLGKNANELLLNFRKLMEPYTASELKVQKRNVLKDFVHIAGPLNVSHLIVFTKSEIAMYMRVIRLPRGPTLTFKISEYCLARDVVSSQKKPNIYEKLFSNSPLLVLNNFSGNGLHFKLMTSMFQGMFPSINVDKANLNTIRRCVLMNYNEDKTIDFRQYSIKIAPTGISKAAKKLIQSKVPDLGEYQDISEYMKSGNLSESEAEVDGLTNQVILPQAISSRGNIKSQKSAIRLFELGPRMTLQCIKIEEGVASGDVLFHEYISKTPEEVAMLKKRQQRIRELKAQRRKEQEENVRKKRLREDSGGENEEEGSSIPQKKRRLWNRIPFNATVNKPEGEQSNVKSLQQVVASRKKRKMAKMKKKRMVKKLKTRSVNMSGHHKRK